MKGGKKISLEEKSVRWNLTHTSYTRDSVFYLSERDSYYFILTERNRHNSRCSFRPPLSFQSVQFLMLRIRRGKKNGSYHVYRCEWTWRLFLCTLVQPESRTRQNYTSFNSHAKTTEAEREGGKREGVSRAHAGRTRKKCTTMIFRNVMSATRGYTDRVDVRALTNATKGSSTICGVSLVQVGVWNKNNLFHSRLHILASSHWKYFSCIREINYFYLLTKLLRQASFAYCRRAPQDYTSADSRLRMYRDSIICVTPTFWSRHIYNLVIGDV